jgi:UDP-3-O-[3-hydroxymyristoyl] N-acetylglucosamine deacetylase/3-hydroxyacyl-[acyl-carrier-protein] dehydratase
LENGLIKGGDLNNAIVYVDKEYLQAQWRIWKLLLEKTRLKPNGILDNLTLHYPNEAARHKLLDVGDLYWNKIQGKLAIE